jgi:carboxylesterase
LLVHAIGGTPVELRFLAQDLNRAGYTVHCPLLAGHGGSDLLLNTTTWHDWRASVDGALTALRAQVDKVVMVGASSSTSLALMAADERASDVDRLALLSPMFWPDGWGIPPWLRLLRHLPTKLGTRHIVHRNRAPHGVRDERIRRHLIEMLTEDGRDLRDVFGMRGGTLIEIARMARTISPRIADIKLPVLLVHARDDEQSRLATTMRLQRRLGGLVDVLVLDDSYHRVAVDRQRDQVAARLIDFSVGADDKGAGKLVGSFAPPPALEA